MSGKPGDSGVEVGLGCFHQHARTRGAVRVRVSSARRHQLHRFESRRRINRSLAQQGGADNFVAIGSIGQCPGPGDGAIEIAFRPGLRDAGQRLLAIRAGHRFCGLARSSQVAPRHNRERIAHICVPIVVGLGQARDHVRQPRGNAPRDFWQTLARQLFPLSSVGQQSVRCAAGVERQSLISAIVLWSKGIAAALVPCFS